MTADDSLPASPRQLILDAASAELQLLADELKAERRFAQQAARLIDERERYDKARARYERARADVEDVRQRLVQAQSARAAGPQPTP